MRKLRRKEKAISNQEEIKSILTSTKYVTLAICRKNNPYLVTVSHGYNSIDNEIYFHCAAKGKKIDYLKTNPLIWGQALIDLGYAKGECNHHYKTAQFKGEVQFLTDIKEKRKALGIMIDQLESENESREKVKKEQLTEKAIERVTIGKIMIHGLSGKEG
jgi:nitroimidazol reductase NimA-like FMN-containing flavoprotein (pyridoxamine 5'-phosphate oxidase superfamily)